MGPLEPLKKAIEHKLRKDIENQIREEQNNKRGSILDVCFIIASTLLVFVLFLSFHYIGPGWCGVVVNMLDKKSDINEKPIGVGITFMAPWKKVYKYPLFEQNVRWENKNAFSFQTCEGQVVWADIGITFAVDMDYTPILLRKYRSGIKEISDRFIRNYLRDAMNIEASKRKVDELYSEKKEQFLLDVQNAVQDKLSNLGIDISRVYILGQFHLPEGITKALNQKMEAGQRAEQRKTEIAEAQAQAQKKIAEAEGEAESMLLKSKAEAESNRILSESLTDELIRYHSLQVWDGKLPQVNGSQSMPFVDLRGNDGTPKG